MLIEAGALNRANTPDNVILSSYYWKCNKAMPPKYEDGIANNGDPDQTALLGVVFSKSLLFA